MDEGRRWSVRDRNGNEVYITNERWAHILDGHPEMAPHENELRETIRSGKRRQDSLNPQKYRYLREVSRLTEDNTHIEVVVLFRFGERADGILAANNYIVTHTKSESGNDMAEPEIKYDEPSDTLYISFAPGERATGIELNENILLRVNRHAGSAVGITLFNFSVLAQRTEMGPRSFPLSGLSVLSEPLRQLALQVLQQSPVRDYLVVSAYSPAGNETFPITYLQYDRLTQRAA